MEAGHRHTQRGLNAYLLGKPERQISKKQTKKDKIKKEIKKKKKKPTRRYVISRWGVGFTGSRVTPTF